MNVLNNKTTKRELKKCIIELLESLYGGVNNEKYFVAYGSKLSDVRNEICKSFENEGLDKNKLDLYMMITQMYDDVFIQVT